jgi:RsmE family RNA methyltransferase
LNIILIESHELTANRVLLSDYRAKHIVKVLKSRVGDTLRVGIVDGNVGEARVENIQSKYPFVVALTVALGNNQDPIPVLDLVLALPRPIMLKRILSQVTALGVGRIYILNANRVEKSFWESGILNPEEYRPHLIQGLEQAIATRLPDIQIRPHFRPFVEDELPQIAANYGQLLLAHPDGKVPLSSCMQNGDGRILFAVGPEGGWVDYEVEKFISAGMHMFSMGERILKVDTATVAIHSRIMQELERSQFLL